MFGLCNQTLYYLLLTIITEICAILIIGYDSWIDYIKENFILTIRAILLYIVIIQVLCFFNQNIFAWILFAITVVLNIVSLSIALNKNAVEFFKNRTPDNNSEKKNDKIN